MFNHTINKRSFLSVQAFVYRLPILQDLSAHYASAPSTGSNAGSSGPAGDIGSTGGAGEGFKEGMDSEERECECERRQKRGSGMLADVCTLCTVFVLGQDGGKRVKQWYDVPIGGRVKR